MPPDKSFRFKSGVLLPAAVAISLLGFFAYQIRSPASVSQGGQRLPRYANQVLAACKDADHKPSCYDREIPKLMDALSLEEAFQVTRLVQQNDPNYFYCHVLGHELASRETARDPARWKDVIPRCPSGMCSNGCLHGAFQERFRAESLPDAEIAELRAELTGLCRTRPGWEPTGLERGTCYHALGHLAMYITAADTRKSLRLCAEILGADGAGGYLPICQDGVFMQIFQPLEPEDFALVKKVGPKRQADLRPFCDSFAGEARAACLRESWPLFAEAVRTPAGLVEFCRQVGEPVWERRCFTGMFYVLAAQFNFDENKIKALCLGLPHERRSQCFSNSASRFIETDYRLIGKSLDFCSTAAALGIGEDCYRELLFYSTYNFHPGSPEFRRLCESLPEPWQARCLNREQVTDFPG